MAETTSEQKVGDGTPDETYTPGYGGPAHLQLLQQRSATVEAGFLLRHLRPGMRLLDCGCGPGTITMGLADVVAPGETVGVDILDGQIQAARALALERGATNVRFEVGDVYELGFEDSSFDAAFAHALLNHLREPVRALREMRRVLKPGGVVGVADFDFGTELLEPATPLLEQCQALRRRVAAYNSEYLGHFWYRARHYRGLLLEAGFVRSEGYARVSFSGTGEATRQRADQLARQIAIPEFADAAIKNGWADATTLEAMAVELRAWGERPDAFYVVTSCQAVGWVPDAK